MKRRNFLSVAGLGSATVFAGCLDSSNVESDSHEERAYDSSPLTEDGKAVHPHHFKVIDLMDITPQTMTVEAEYFPNMNGPYKVHAHLVERTPENPGEWNMEPIFASYAVGMPDFDEEAREFKPNDTRLDRPNIHFDGVGKRVSTIEIRPDVPVDEAGRGIRNEISGQSIPAGVVFDFDLEEEPPINQPFQYVFTWEDPLNSSGKEGEIITRSPHILRLEDDTFVYPRWHDTELPVKYPSWDGYGIHVNEWRGYQMHEVYRTDISNSNGMFDGQFVRISNYGRFSQTGMDITKKANDVGANWEPNGGSTVPGGAPAHLTGPIQNPWVFDLEWDEELIDDANDLARSITTSSDYYNIWELMNDERVLNNELLQDTAEQLDLVCQQIGANLPTEQIRVIADFVQYMEYSPTTRRPNPSFKRPTAHPASVLASNIGDCTSYTVLGGALLQQDPFNFNTSVGVFEDLTFVNASGETQPSRFGHTSVGIAMSDLEIDDLDSDYLGHAPPLGTTTCSFNDLGEEYMYVEMSVPYPLGAILDAHGFEVTPTPVREKLS